MSSGIAVWQAIATTAAVAVTLLAALVALFGPNYREWRTRPQLRVQWDAAGSVTVRPQGKPQWVFARPRVDNETGRRTAQDVEILVTQIEPTGETPASTEPLIAGRALAWSDVGQSKVSIAPGASRRFDLVHVTDPDELEPHKRAAAPSGQTPLTIDVHRTPADQRHRLPPGSYKLLVAITARDVDTVCCSFDIRFDGDWREGAPGLNVELTK